MKLDSLTANLWRTVRISSQLLICNNTGGNCIKRWSVQIGQLWLVDGVQGGEDMVCLNGQAITSDRQPESF